MEKKASIIIQSRIDSLRFPEKAIKIIGSKPMIWHVINRVKTTKNVEQIILATTKSKKDDILQQIAKKSNILVFSGPKKDVLKRYVLCAEKFNADPIIRITGDCPLIDPNIISEFLDFYKKNNFNYVTNTLTPTYPDGLDVEIISLKTLKYLDENAKLKSEREHVTSYIKNHPKKFKIYNFKNKVDLSNYRWTVDTKEDIYFIRKIFSKMRPKLLFGTKDIIKIINEDPKILKINSKFKRNEGYKKSLMND